MFERAIDLERGRVQFIDIYRGDVDDARSLADDICRAGRDDDPWTERTASACSG